MSGHGRMRRQYGCGDCIRCLAGLRRGAWRPACPRVLAAVPAPQRGWVAWPRSMTRRLAEVCGAPVRVEVARQARGGILGHERRLLGPRAAPAVVRQVVLRAGDRPVLAARTVLPLATAKGANALLLRLGRRPLGEVLFSHGRGRWRAREAALSRPEAPEWRGIDLPRLMPAGVRQFWARRTVYLLSGRPLLVVEAFLPALFEVEALGAT